MPETSGKQITVDSVPMVQVACIPLQTTLVLTVAVSTALFPTRVIVGEQSTVMPGECCMFKVVVDAMILRPAICPYILYVCE